LEHQVGAQSFKNKNTMKKLCIICLFTFTFSLFTPLCEAQFNTYHPFPDSDAYWNETADNGSCGTGVDSRQYDYIIHGDTTTNGYLYHKVYRIWGYWSNTCSTPYQVWLYDSTFYGAYRSDTMKHIYACCTGYLGSHDSLLYDFNLKVGDTLTQYTARVSGGPWPWTVHSIDSVLVWSTYRKRFNLECNGDTAAWQVPSIVEGIGSTDGLFDFLVIPFEITTSLNCFTQVDSTWQPPGGNSNVYCGLFYAGINELNAPKAAVSVYPNPSAGLFTVSFSRPELLYGTQTIKIYNILGEAVLTETLHSVQGDNLIDLGNNPNGIYLYRVMTETGELLGEGKIIVQQ
jgi:hypothetical protein